MTTKLATRKPVITELGEIVEMTPADEINYEFAQVQVGVQSVMDHAFRLGWLLRKQKEDLKLHCYADRVEFTVSPMAPARQRENAEADADAQTWSSWVKENCNFSLRTAQRYMRLSEHATRVSHLEPNTSMRSALRMLTEPKEPKPKQARSAKKAEPAGEIAFSWVKEPFVLDMLRARSYVKRGIYTLTHADKDFALADYLLRRMRKYLLNLVEEINLKLGDHDE